MDRQYAYQLILSSTKKDFVSVLDKYDAKLNKRPARRHSKLGSVESSNFTLRVITERLIKDARHYKLTKGLNYTDHEILSRAVFLANVLHGQKNCSALELARGYTPAISGLSHAPLDQKLLEAHQEQTIRSALSKLMSGNIPKTIIEELLPKGTPIYFFEKKTEHGIWNIGYIQSTHEHYVEVSRNKKARGKLLQVAYEGIRTFPSSSLLHQLDQLEAQEGSNFDQDSPETDAVENVNNENQRRVQLTSPITEDATEPQNQAALWASHLCSAAYFSSHQDIRYRNKKLGPVLDIGKPTSMALPHKDIGDTKLISPSMLPEELESAEQRILHSMRDTVGDKPVSESRLQFAPRWIIDKAIQKEKENFAEKEAYKEVNIRDLPKNANLISSHHFFQIKTDGSTKRLKLNCRLVSHGNKDKDKDFIRKDSATAQFPVIRALLSAATILGFRLGTIDISGAYLQAGPLNRDVYVRLPKGWTPSSFIIWKLLVPSYGLVEAGRIWQLAVEYWMEQVYGTETVTGFIQLFVVRNKNMEVILLIAKVVDDFLIAGKVQEIQKFHDAIAKRFMVGRFICNEDLVFDRLHIHQEADGSVHVSMEEYMSKISALHFDRKRRKEQEVACTPQERKAFLSLAGQLNWLGHGTLPQAAYVPSLLQQWTDDLRVKHLVDANKTLHELRRLKPTMRYETPSESDLSNNSNALLAFTDASQGRTSYGQTGYIAGIYFGNSQAYHLLDWHSSKQGRVSYPSVGTEIIAAADSADRASLPAFALHDLYRSKTSIPLILTTGSHGIYSTITTLHEGKDYRLRPTVSRLRDSFESNEISVIQWIPGKHNISDALTKRNYSLFRTLNHVAVTGRLPSAILESTEPKLAEV